MTINPVPVPVLVLVSVLACDRPPRPQPTQLPPSPPTAALPAPPSTAATDALVVEPPDSNPTAETVTLKLVVDQRRQAHVYWGRKDLGVAPLEITRPKNSGPLDLVVLAPGYLPLHTRVFTDRDDKIGLRLYAESEGPSLLGFRQSP